MKNRLIDYAYENFNCQPGPSCSWFEIPQRQAESIRVIYIAYTAQGSGRDKLEQWFLDNVFVPLRDAAGQGAYLYWRLSGNCIELTEISPSMWRVYTRLAVLDKDLNPVVIDDVVKVEGQKMKELEDDST